MTPPDCALAPRLPAPWRVLATFPLLVAACMLLQGCACCRTSAPGATAAANAPTESTRALFDGSSLNGWQVTDFAGHGEVTAADGQILLGLGFMTGITYTNPVPSMNYEISLQAMRVEGSDFFCGLTFPVGTNVCSFIVGGWGGGVVGLSNIDGQDASSNETTTYLSFESGRWYDFRVRVTPDRIEAWIDGDRVVDQPLGERRISIRVEMELSMPLGIATWNTSAALRNIVIRPLPASS